MNPVFWMGFAAGVPVGLVLFWVLLWFFDEDVVISPLLDEEGRIVGYRL